MRAEHIVGIPSTYPNILEWSFHCKKSKKNDEQTCNKHKLADVWLNQCHKISASSRARKTEHIRSKQDVTASQSKIAPNFPNRDSHGIHDLPWD